MPEWTGLMLFHKIELLHDAPVKHIAKTFKETKFFPKSKNKQKTPTYSTVQTALK